MKKVTSTRVEEEILSKYAEIYKSAAAGTTVAIESFISLRVRTLNEIKGIFTNEEITAIVANLNGTMRQEAFMYKSVFIASIEDGEKFDHLSTQYSFDYAEFIKKIEKLTEAQSYFLMDRIFLFWENNESLEALLKEMC